MLQWFRNLPIRWKVTVVSLATTCSVLLAASIAFFVYDQISFRRQFLSRTASLAKVVGANSTAALTFRDAKVGEKIISTLRTEPHVMFCALYDMNEQLLASYRRAGVEEDLLPFAVVPNGYHWYAGRLSVFVPVVLEGERIGIVFIAKSMKPVYARLGRYAAVVLIVLGASILVAWALSSYLQSYVSRPITQLKDTTEAITAGGDFTLRAEGESFDEIGALVSGFNTMLEQIQARDSELRNYQERLRSLASELMFAEEKERRRIATGLHDSISQKLMVALMKLKILLAERDRSSVDVLAGESENLVDSALTEVRSLTFQLSPPALYELGLKEALRRLCEQVAAEYDLKVVYHESKLDGEVSENVEVLLYRAVRELLFNVFKHASAETVTVETSSKDNHVCIKVSDDGIGFDPPKSLLAAGGGFGLFSIRERLSHMGGKMTVIAEPGLGTTVILDAPAKLSDQAA